MSSTPTSPAAAECSICLEALHKPGVSYTVGGCGHSFHNACLTAMAVHGQVNCPLCRAPIDILAAPVGHAPAAVLAPPAAAAAAARGGRHGGLLGRVTRAAGNLIRSSTPLTRTRTPRSSMGTRPFSPSAHQAECMASSQPTNYTDDEPVFLVPASVRPGEAPLINMEVQHECADVTTGQFSGFVSMVTAEMEDHAFPGVDLVCLLDVSGSMR
jgi:hypothetical protein